MTEAGDVIRSALERHAVSVNAARDTANALAVEREQRTAESAAVAAGRVTAADDYNE